MTIFRLTVCDVFASSVIVGALLLAAASAQAADLLESVDDAYAVRRLEHTELAADPGCELRQKDRLFLETLHERSDEVVLLNTNVLRWFASGGRKGLHAAEYAMRVESSIERLREVDVPARAKSVRAYLIEAVGLQRDFIAGWLAAEEAGLAFPSQLTDEYAYHEGLHRSQRLLLKSHAELRAVLPEICDNAKQAIRDHLRAMVIQ